MGMGGERGVVDTVLHECDARNEVLAAIHVRMEAVGQ